MLRNIAVAILAACIFSAPALARSHAVRTTGHATVIVPAGPAKVAPAKFVRHIKKHRRHRHATHYRHLRNGKSVTATPAVLPARRGART